MEVYHRRFYNLLFFMMYVNSIKTAIFVFPIIAFLFTIPFILHQYHKYGSIHKLRVLIIYSFILYMLTIYFLVILPLPKIEDVHFKENMIRLIPFGFIHDFIKESSFVLMNPSTYLKALKEPCFYTVIFNLLMTVPFGMYLRYYFKCDLKKVIKYSFLLSLFFELTQITGLYFIYKYPYRVFDIDDLIINTLGGIIGYYGMGLFNRFLPTRETMDIESLKEGKIVSSLRRITLFFLDSLLMIAISILVATITQRTISFIGLFILYYGIIPIGLKNQTIGSKFLNIKFEYPNWNFIRNIIRPLFLYMYYIGIPILCIISSFLLIDKLQLGTHEAIILYFGTLCFLMIFFLSHFIYFLKNHRIFYDRVFKCEFKSTIQGDLNE